MEGLVKEQELADFSGGLKAGFAATDFTDRQWSELFGVLFDADRTLRAQWAIQGLTDDTVESFWVWDGKIVYRRANPFIVTAPGGGSGSGSGSGSGDPIEVYWFGAGLPADDTNDPLNFYQFSDVIFIWNDPVNGFWDSGFVWS